NGTDEDILSYVKPAAFAPGTMKISQLLKKMQEIKTHIAIIVDEYGGTMGLLTLEDILEELVGEIYDEHDEIVEQFRKLPDGSWQIDAGAELEDMQERFNFTDDSDAATVSGWVVEKLGRIPEVGDSFACGDLFVRVTQVEATKVLEINVRKDEPEKKDEAK
ncbi:MAG: CBS domain-containing protein, partial [Clostridia bacterium]|nr:CBS domain-containing protein [Clostridia bacterium]